jgi:hypothetical protein
MVGLVCESHGHIILWTYSTLVAFSASVSIAKSGDVHGAERPLAVMLIGANIFMLSERLSAKETSFAHGRLFDIR